MRSLRVPFARKLERNTRSDLINSRTASNRASSVRHCIHTPTTPAPSYDPLQALVLPPILLPLLLLIEVIQQHGWPAALSQDAYSDELISAVSGLCGLYP